MNKAIIIQARMTSTRLPGKVLKEFSIGKTVIGVLLTRLEKIISNDFGIIVATSNLESDDILVDYLNLNYNWVEIYRGSIDNVAERYLDAALKYDIETIVRITADCPLVDPDLIIDMYQQYELLDLEYLSNTMPPEKSTFSDGFDIEIFKTSGLKKILELPELTNKDKEHVTFLFWKSKYFKSGYFKNTKTQNFQFKLSIDNIEDFKIVDSILNNIGINRGFSEIEEFLNSHKQVAQINLSSKKNIGWNQ